jgi:hypothetical protein
MKKYLFVLVLSSFLLSSCGTNLTQFYNSTNQMTQVELSENNFTVVERVTGEADNIYIFGIGGLFNKDLLGQAKNNMMEKAGLVGTSRAIVNISYDRHVLGVAPFYYEVKVTASGYVVEFTD